MRSVLIVDDEIAVIGAMREALSGLPYRLIATTDPHNALTVLQNDNSIELLITDLFMPGMDGEELLGKSRSIRSDLRVVLTTGIASPAQLRAWKARGEFVVAKPWHEEEFIGTIESALDTAPRRGRPWRL